ncbi:hypothetical protein HPB50_024233 [Hyalomma asiaticum]|uniref:Uncharacterized protein n=1 Tax=Hyalomma asiaticum TaxID=266040 RepID=A0ACB7SKY1_HYAAI|nr:hypothetical protein HPB50_024233 [Hyalomma asiaticum]
MEGTTHNTSEPKSRSLRSGLCRYGDVSVTRRQGIDENVVESFRGEDVQMKGLRNVHLDHVDHAERRGISSTERCSVGDYVRRVRTNSLAKEPEAREVDATSSLRSRSPPPDSSFGDLELSGIGLATPPPLLYARKPVLRRKAASVRAATITKRSSKASDKLKCEPDNRFTSYEQCDGGSSHGGDASGTSSKKDSQRLQRKVF